jgi:hypothetical protein
VRRLLLLAALVLPGAASATPERPPLQFQRTAGAAVPPSTQSSPAAVEPGKAPTRLLSRAVDFGPSWSPDGGSVAYARPWRGGGAAIFTLPASGGPATRLIASLRLRNDLAPDWG